MHEWGKIKHEENPQKYSEIPRWDFLKLEEMSIDGLVETDDFKFYKYKLVMEER